VVVVAVLVELDTPDVSLELPPAVLPEPVVPEPDVEPEAPIELVLPLPVEPPVEPPLPAVVLPLVEPEPLVPGVVLPPAVLPVAGVLVLDELVEVEGEVPASSRLVQAPRETAATSASAAHVVRDAFIEDSLGIC
jgi:hypothetical protein